MDTHKSRSDVLQKHATHNYQILSISNQNSCCHSQATRARTCPLACPFGSPIISNWSTGVDVSCVKTRKEQFPRKYRRFCNACSWIPDTGATSPTTSNIRSNAWWVRPITCAVSVKHSVSAGYRVSVSVNGCFPAASTLSVSHSKG